MSSLNNFVKPYPEPKFPKLERNSDMDNDDSLLELEKPLSGKEKGEREKFEKEIKKNIRY